MSASATLPVVCPPVDPYYSLVVELASTPELITNLLRDHDPLHDRCLFGGPTTVACSIYRFAAYAAETRARGAGAAA